MTVISVLSIMSVPAVLNTDTNSHVKMVSYALKAQENLLLVLLDTTVRRAPLPLIPVTPSFRVQRLAVPVFSVSEELPTTLR
jgi:hypothetical protein